MRGVAHQMHSSRNEDRFIDGICIAVGSGASFTEGRGASQTGAPAADPPILRRLEAGEVPDAKGSHVRTEHSVAIAALAEMTIEIKS